VKEGIAFLLPPATACVGMRLNRLVLGGECEARFGLGLRFALGLGTGMLVFSQLVLLTALAGINASAWLAWCALFSAVVEIGLRLRKSAVEWQAPKLQRAHLWLLLLLPVAYSWWVFGQLSTLEGTLEFDANAFWVFKAKLLFLVQGRSLWDVLHQPSLAYAHLDYPMLVPCLYTMGYGAMGRVDEFVNKVWPFWMVVALCLGILSLGKIWRRPHPLPIGVVLVFCFLPASLQFIRNEGGTLPMAFFVSLAAQARRAATLGGKAQGRGIEPGPAVPQEGSEQVLDNGALVHPVSHLNTIISRLYQDTRKAEAGLP